MKITKQLVTRMGNVEPEVRVINGMYKEATATVTYSNGWKYIVRVYRIHDALKPFASIPSSKAAREFCWPRSPSSWSIMPVPPELEHIADMLYDAALTTDDEAVEMMGSRSTLIEDFNKAFYGED